MKTSSFCNRQLFLSLTLVSSLHNSLSFVRQASILVRPVVNPHRNLASTLPSGTALSAITGVHNKKDDNEGLSISRKRDMPKKVIRAYADYASRLWNETNPEARRKIANDKASQAIKDVQHILMVDGDDGPIQARKETKMELAEACAKLLAEIETHKVSVKESENTKQSSDVAAPKEKKSRSVLFGALMGAVVAAWVFSGKYVFTGLFTLMTILGQLEYYRMVQSTGVYPARKISVIGAASMFLTALFFPDYHQICLPLFGCWAMIWFLTMKRSVTTIPEIATTFSGMFYLGYVPSFWVRLHLMGASSQQTKLASLMTPFLGFIEKKADIFLPNFITDAIVTPFTGGAVFIFWAWLSLAFSDVGAYFVGRRFGKTKLGAVSPAAGKTSPNKTVEGVLGGCLAAAFFSTIGEFDRSLLALYGLPILKIV